MHQMRGASLSCTPADNGGQPVHLLLTVHRWAMNSRTALILALAWAASCSAGDNPPDHAMSDAADADDGDGGAEAGDAEPDKIDGSPACAVLDEGSCQLEAQKHVCTALYGWKVPGGAKQFVACRGYCLGGATFTCAVDFSTVCWKFPDTCTPDGWASVPNCDADAAPTCKGALDGGV